MKVADLVRPEAIIPNMRVTSKKQALQELANRAAEITDLPARDIFDTILERERLGTTGVGQGIAIPHGKMRSIGGLYGVFARLEQPIAFDSIDDQPVDLIFLLLAPEEAGADHLKALAKISRLLRDQTICRKLRGSDGRDAIYVLLTQASARDAA